jgi:ABC-type multidrug transport system permease subunit
VYLNCERYVLISFVDRPVLRDRRFRYRDTYLRPEEPNAYMTAVVALAYIMGVMCGAIALYVAFLCNEHSVLFRNVLGHSCSSVLLLLVLFLLLSLIIMF